MKVDCVRPNGQILPINCEQVDVLPNFAMTDYSLQGHTRPVNVIDLTGCNFHFSYYTCFSRSSTVDGTIVIEGINSHTGRYNWLVITGI